METNPKCQHRRWYKLPSGKNGSVEDCDNPAKERSRIVRTGLAGIHFDMVEVTCDEHAA